MHIMSYWNMNIGPANCEYLYYSSSSSRLLGVLLLDLETTLMPKCSKAELRRAHLHSIQRDSDQK